MAAVELPPPPALCACGEVHERAVQAGDAWQPAELIPVPDELREAPINPKNASEKVVVRYDAGCGGFLGFEVIASDRRVPTSWYSSLETLPHRLRERVLQPVEEVTGSRRTGQVRSITPCKRGHPGSARTYPAGKKSYCSWCSFPRLIPADWDETA